MLNDRGLFDLNGAWYVRVQLGGIRRQYGGFPTKSSARTFRDKKKAEYKLGLFLPEQQASRSELLSCVIDRYLDTTVNKKSLRNECSYAVWWKNALGTRKISSIQPIDIEHARITLLRSGRLTQRTPATVNRFVAWLRHVLYIEVRQGRLARNPVCMLKRFKEPPSPTIYVDEAMEQRIGKILGPYAEWVRLAILLGLRQYEQFTLRWAWLDLDSGIGILPDTKGGDAQPFIISEEARNILRSLPSYNTSPFVFPNPKHPDRPINGQNWYNVIFKRKLKSAGIKVGRPNGIVWHTLRHTFGSRLAMSGASDRDIMHLGRWKSSSMVTRYTHLRPSHLQAIVNRLSLFKSGRESAHMTDSPTNGHAHEAKETS